MTKGPRLGVIAAVGLVQEFENSAGNAQQYFFKCLFADWLYFFLFHLFVVILVGKTFHNFNVVDNSRIAFLVRKEVSRKNLARPSRLCIAVRTGARQSPPLPKYVATLDIINRCQGGMSFLPQHWNLDFMVGIGFEHGNVVIPIVLGHVVLRIQKGRKFLHVLVPCQLPCGAVVHQYLFPRRQVSGRDKVQCQTHRRGRAPIQRGHGQPFGSRSVLGTPPQLGIHLLRSGCVVDQTIGHAVGAQENIQIVSSKAIIQHQLLVMGTKSHVSCRFTLKGVRRVPQRQIHVQHAFLGQVNQGHGSNGFSFSQGSC
mmetsp:Transcript_20084/g.55464  ORF Transcript_20084/g.55464 Transcript_20084/m.55464 type:complete len:312 (-) Transcript_20084:552-1487(-)